MPSMLIGRIGGFGGITHFTWPSGRKNQASVGGMAVGVSRTVAEKAPITSITISSMVSNSSVGIYRADTGALLLSDIPGVASKTYSVQYVGLVIVEVRQGKTAPFYKPWLTQLTISGFPATIIAIQELD